MKKLKEPKKLGVFEKKLLKYLAGCENRRTFAPAFEKYTARGHERKSSLKGLHRQRKVVQEASRLPFPLGDDGRPGRVRRKRCRGCAVGVAPRYLFPIKQYVQRRPTVSRHVVYLILYIWGYRQRYFYNGEFDPGSG